MTTISLKLPAVLATRLKSHAATLQKNKSVLVREFIERGLSETDRRSPSFHELAADKCGIGRSRLPDLATNPRHLDDYGR